MSSRLLGYEWRLVAMLWPAVLLNYAVRLTAPAVLDLIRTDLHLGSVQLGLLGVGTAFAVPYGICSPFAGRIVDRLGSRSTVVGSIYAWSAVSLLTGLTRSFGELLICCAAQGIAQSLYFPAATSLISVYHEPSTRSRALGLHQNGLYMGIVAGSVLSASIGSRYGWRVAFVVLGSVGLALAITLQFGLREPPQAITRGAASVSGFLRIILSSRVCILLSLAFVCANFAGAVFLNWMPTHVHRKFIPSLTMASFSATVFAQFACMISAPLGGWMADSMVHRGRPHGRVLVQSLGLLFSAPFIFLSGYSRSLALLYLSLWLWGWFKGIYDANIFASMFDEVGVQYRGISVGFMNMLAWALGAAIGPPLVGCIAERSSLGAGISLTCLVCLAGGALLAVAARIKSKVSADAITSAGQDQSGRGRA